MFCVIIACLLFHMMYLYTLPSIGGVLFYRCMAAI